MAQLGTALSTAEGGGALPWEFNTVNATAIAITIGMEMNIAVARRFFGIINNLFTMSSVKFKFITGATSATRLFAGRWRPQFFRLLTAQVANAVEILNVNFDELYKDKAFRSAMKNAFEEFKRWFFETAVHKFCIQKGDLFSITMDAEVDMDAKTIRFYYDKAEVAVWRRVVEPCGGGGECEKKLSECESQLTECRKKIEDLKALLK